MSKVLQALSNHVTFDKKEPFMIPLNGLIEDNFSLVNKFYESVTVTLFFLIVPDYIKSVDAGSLQNIDVPLEIYQSALTYLTARFHGKSGSTVPRKTTEKH